MENTVGEEVKRARCEILKSDMLGMKKNVLARHLSACKSCEILLENQKNGVWSGHTPEMIEARVTVSRDGHKTDDIISAKPYRSDGKILYYSEEG